MKFLLKIIFFCVLLKCNNLFAQVYIADSLYNDYFKSTTSIDQKIQTAPTLVAELCIMFDYEKAELVISDLQKLKVQDNRVNFKNGLLALSNSLLSKSQDNLPKSIEFAQQAAKLLKNDPHYLAEAQSLLVMDYYAQAKFDTCIKIGNAYLADINKSKNVTSQLEVLMCVGRSYDFIGDRKKAIETSLLGVELAKKEHKKNKLSEVYISLSSIYKGEDIQKSKKYALLSARVLEESKGYQKSIVLNSSYLIIGNVYNDLQMQDSATYYYNLCKENSSKTKDYHTYLSAIGNLGNIAYEQKDYKKAIEYNLLTLYEYKKIGVNTEIAVAYGSLADIYKDIKEYQKAVKYYDSALVITKLIQSADDYIYNYKGLSQTYELMGNDKEALKYYRLYRSWNDSVNNNQNSKKINEIEIDYKYKVEQREKDLIQTSKDLVTQEKIKHQKYIIWVAVLGGLSLVIFLGFTIKSNIEKKKTNVQLQVFNNEIIEQKNIIEEKNNEITDSITYASRIQQGVIPDEEELKELLPSHFVFFKPRDIVSGDFYWACKVKSKTEPHVKRTVVAVVDCTGHGVPGAFMSLVGNTLLNQTIGRSAISNPAQALDYMNVQLPKTIKSKVSTGAIKDGMEIAMCDFNFDTLTLQFAGANSNIYIVRNGEIKIYKGDKQPIGESLTEKNN